MADFVSVFRWRGNPPAAGCGALVAFAGAEGCVQRRRDGGQHDAGGVRKNEEALPFGCHLQATS